MTLRTAAALVGIVITAVTVATLIGSTLLYGFDPVSAAFGLWAIVGATIVALRPGNAVGWLFGAVGLLWVTGFLASEIAGSAGLGGGHTLATWWSEWTWVAGFVCMASSLLLIPTGHTTSPRWAWALRIYGSAGGAVIVVTWFQETLQGADDAPTVENPIGVAGIGDVADAAAGPLLLFGGLTLGLASLVVRFRRGDAEERRRLKLIALAAVVMVAAAVAGAALEEGLLAGLAWAVAAGVVPVACGAAILRHQLFDVDVVISRALVYGSLTVILGAAYAGLVLAGQAVFSSFAGGGDLAIAVSTLVVAALFLPVRSRVQRVVDRRFYRRRYDAQRTLEAFGVRVREEVELRTLSADLHGVVAETMQPAHVSLWLRQETRA